MENKRKAPRGNVNLKASLRKIKKSLSSGSRITDISETGMRMPLNLYFPVDSLLEVEIIFEDLNISILTLARVARITERNNSRYRFDVGFEFLNLPLEKQDLLRKYVHQSLSHRES